MTASLSQDVDPRDHVHYKGVYWRDIDWDKSVHEMERCDHCGSDGAEGHQSSCEYLIANQRSPRGQRFLREQIRLALEREGKL